jgi:uncharacterized caspase-like protein
LRRLKRAEPEDAVLLFFAGHGLANKDRFYLLPHDLGYSGPGGQMSEAEFGRMLAHGISDRELEAAFEGVDAGRLLLVIDACNSGQALEAEERRRGPMNSRGLAQLAYEKGMYILSASQGFQAALEVSELGHGLLTYALVEEGLKQMKADAAPADKQLDLREWLDYAVERVPQLQQKKLEEGKLRGAGSTFVPGDEELPPEQRRLQRPRVFYRRELESKPLIVARIP